MLQQHVKSHFGICSNKIFHLTQEMSQITTMMKKFTTLYACNCILVSLILFLGQIQRKGNIANDNQGILASQHSILKLIELYHHHCTLY